MVFVNPDAENYTVVFVMRILRDYKIDGLHLDRIRYPEIGVAGQTPSTGVSIGYNQTSIERFQRVNNIPAGRDRKSVVQGKGVGQTGHQTNEKQKESEKKRRESTSAAD